MAVRNILACRTAALPVNLPFHDPKQAARAQQIAEFVSGALDVVSVPVI